MTTAILIPARYDSTRFPAKPLADLNGKTLIRRVYDRCIETGLDTYVLTDHETIAAEIPASQVIIDKSGYDCGTSRCMSVIDEVLQYDRYINVQGDMPDITVDIIKKVEAALQYADVATAYTTMDFEKRQDPNAVKMIHTRGRAHWFCRAALTYGDHHLGIYGYNRESKIMWTTARKFPEENLESLEQLRWLQNDVKIAVVEVDFNGIEINTEQDLEEWQKKNFL